MSPRCSFVRKVSAELIRRVLEETGLAPEYLQLELTESVLLSNADMTLSVLRELKEMGLKLSIDDFGTGYSSFSYLRHFSVDKLKIDQSFVRDVVDQRRCGDHHCDHQHGEEPAASR